MYRFANIHVTAVLDVYDGPISTRVTRLPLGRSHKSSSLETRSLTEAVDANRQANDTEEKCQAKDGYADQGTQQRLLFKPEVTCNTRRHASWNWNTDVNQVLTTIASIPICAPTKRPIQLVFI
jgi:hypothetical protein